MGRELGRTAPSHRSADFGINLFRWWGELSTWRPVSPTSSGLLLVRSEGTRRSGPHRPHLLLVLVGDVQFIRNPQARVRLIRREDTPLRASENPPRSSRGPSPLRAMSFAPSPVSIRNLRPAPWERGHLARSFSPLRAHVVRAISRVNQKPPSSPLGTRASCPFRHPVVRATFRAQKSVQRDAGTRRYAHGAFRRRREEHALAPENPPEYIRRGGSPTADPEIVPCPRRSSGAPLGARWPRRRGARRSSNCHPRPPP